MAKAKKDKLTIEDALISVEEQPYKVPENWCWTKLAPIVNIQTGKKDANYGCEDGEYYFFTCAAEPIRCADYSYDCKAVLLAGNGDISNISIYEGKFEAYQRTYIVESEKDILTEYLYYYFKYRWVDYNLDKMFGTAIPYIRLGNLNDFEVPIPPLEEQKRIVTKIENMFTKLDEVLDKVNTAYEMNEEQIKSITQKAFKGELTRHYEHKKIELVEIQDMFEVVGGIQKKPNRAPKNNPIPYVTVANVYRNRVDISDIKYFEVFEGELEKLQLHEKDILVVEGNGSGNEIGRCAMWNNELPVCIHQNHIIRLRKKNDSVNPEYVLRYLNSEQGKDIMKQKAVTTAGLYNLSTGKIKTITFPYVSIEEQDEIVTILDRLYDDNEVIQNNLLNIKEKVFLLKKSILARAFRGEFGTNDPKDESAIELLKTILDKGGC